MSIKNTRVKYYDVLKFWAILLIAGTHYIGRYNETYFSYWKEMPTALFLSGITGKLGVAVLGCIMCMMAYKSSTKNPVQYIFTRYFYFFLGGTIINLLYIYTGIYDGWMNTQFVINTCFSLGRDIFDTYWCMQSFFVACVVAYLNGYYKISNKILIIEMVLFGLAGYNWVSICLFGELAVSLCENKSLEKYLSNRWIKAFILVLVFVIIKREESITAYYIDGFSVMLILVVLHYSQKLQWVLNKCRLSAFLGRYTMPIFLIHWSIYVLIGDKLFVSQIFNGMDYKYIFVICFICLFVIMIPICILLQKILDFIMGFVKKLFGHLGA